MNRGQFMAHVFADPRLEIPKTTHTRRAWQAENQAELSYLHAKEGAHFNPTNTTLRMDNSTDFNSVHVQSYVSVEQGIEATVRTLAEARYTTLREAFQSNRDAAYLCSLWGASPWGTASALMMTIRAELARVQFYLRTLERTEIAGP